MKMPATFSEAFFQAELDYRRERLTGVAARQPRVRKPAIRRRWRRVTTTTTAPVPTQPTEAATAVCRPIHAGTLH
ncbi:MAG TPA: hypothetical protein VHW92_05995 [Mycobacteriales bacterium]|jgi:hypothetical protein|nr:hypothetical protein [Mycobacteriales bacterium]